MIYFIRPIGFEGPVKIGTTIALAQRLKTLHQFSPFPLEVVAQIEGDKLLECRFHERFIDTHCGYEWFTWTSELQATIDAINAGTFDTSTLPQAKSAAPLQRGKPSFWTPERRPWARRVARHVGFRTSNNVPFFVISRGMPRPLLTGES